MKLDEHHLIIRERSYIDLADLSVRVFSTHFVQLSLALIIGALPFYLLNIWLLRDWISFSSDIYFQEQTDLTNYYIYSSILMVIESPLVTLWMTLFLGHWTFGGKFSLSKTIEQGYESLPQLFIYSVLLRPGLFLYRFLPEVILLEQTPLFRNRQTGISTFNRAKALHWGEKGEQFGHMMMNFTFAVPLIAIATKVSVGMIELFSGSLLQANDMIPWVFPVITWYVIGFFVVFRYLAYLNLRIRHEGWDVELAMRVERTKMKGPVE